MSSDMTHNSTGWIRGGIMKVEMDTRYFARCRARDRGGERVQQGARTCREGSAPPTPQASTRRIEHGHTSLIRAIDVQAAPWRREDLTHRQLPDAPEQLAATCNNGPWGMLSWPSAQSWETEMVLTMNADIMLPEISAPSCSAVLELARSEWPCVR